MNEIYIILTCLILFVLICLMILNTYRIFLYKGDFLGTRNYKLSNIDNTFEVSTVHENNKFGVINQKFKETQQSNETNISPEDAKQISMNVSNKFQYVSEENSLNISKIESEVDDLNNKLHVLQNQLNSINYDMEE